MTDHARRKALIAAYKLAFPPMGIYAVRNLATGRMLLDRSANTTAALNRHRAQLRFGQHRIAALQEDWHEQGETAFVFEVLERIEERADPAFDYDTELARLLEAWRARVPAGSDASYL